MREICTSGSVGARRGNSPGYPTQAAAAISCEEFAWVPFLESAAFQDEDEISDGRTHACSAGRTHARLDGRSLDAPGRTRDRLIG